MTDPDDTLPAKLREIAAEIGMEPALKLAAAWPGVRVFVPKHMTAEHPIAVAIGLPAARALAQYCGGESIVPPLCQRYHRARLHAQILAEYRSGATAAELARKYGVHQFTIYNLAARDTERRQGSLL